MHRKQETRVRQNTGFKYAGDRDAFSPIAYRQDFAYRIIRDLLYVPD